MKIFTFLLPLTLLLTTIHTPGARAQAPGILWQKSLGGNEFDYGNCVQQTDDGGYVIAGTTTSNNAPFINHGGNDVYIARLSAMGDVIWQRLYGGMGNEFAYAIRATIDGGFIATCSSNSTNGDVSHNAGGYDVWVIKLSATGDIEWETSFGGSADDAAYDIRQTIDTGYILCGRTSSSDGIITANHGGYDCQVLKLSKTGSLQWQHTYGGSGADNAMSVIQTSDTGYIIAGDTYSTNGDITLSHGDEDFWVAKLSATGDIQWQKCYGGTKADYAQCIRQLPGNGYIIAGGSNSDDGNISANAGRGDFWVVRITETGSIMWERSLGSTNDDAANSVEVTTEGDFVVAGWVTKGDGNVTGFHGANDYWLVKLSGSGSMLWQKSLGGEGYERATCAVVSGVDEYVATGYSSSTSGDVTDGHGNADCWVVKLSHAAGIDLIKGKYLINVIPNPTTGNLSVKGLSNINIAVSSIAGAVLRQVYNSNTVNIADLAPGVYLVTITDRDGSLLKQEMVVKQ